MTNSSKIKYTFYDIKKKLYGRQYGQLMIELKGRKVRNYSYAYKMECKTNFSVLKYNSDWFTKTQKSIVVSDSRESIKLFNKSKINIILLFSLPNVIPSGRLASDTKSLVMVKSYYNIII